MKKVVMTPDEFQEWARVMWNWGGRKKPFTQRDDYIMATGLGGEAGEVLEVLKKLTRDKKFKKTYLVKELGDVLYYLCIIASRHDIKMSDVIKGNIKKLQRRQKLKAKKKALAEVMENRKQFLLENSV